MYKLLDSGNFQKLEQVGPFKVVRPSPQAVWKPDQSLSEWMSQCDAHFERYSDGKGEWKVKNKKIESPFTVDFNDIQMIMKLTSFGHLGVFVEQIPQWLKIQNIVKKALKTQENFKILNLFAYTGGATVSALKAGAEVVHLDASKTSVAWAKENAERSNLAGKPVRWMVDDVQKFVQKEVRRGSKYHGILLDPPSFGRGANNEVWKIEEHLIPLLDGIKQLMDDKFSFIQLSSHSQGYTPLALKNLLQQVCDKHKGEYVAEELVVLDKTEKALPSGAHCFFTSQV
jgi:23S rRNA (cytosine1962-C5)-methyltransferase